jgi:hypothetical protein
MAIVLSMLVTISCSGKQSTETGHRDHLAKVNEHGDKAMGFSHEKTKHQFVLLKDGGVIQIKVNNSDDKESLTKVRKHLGEISKMFSAGDFQHPVATHGKEPAGVPKLKELKSDIDYQYEEIEDGGRVRITTKNADALKAIHQFLLFQIDDHQTGDSKEIADSLN